MLLDVLALHRIALIALAACTFDNGYRKWAGPKVRGEGGLALNLCWNAEWDIY